jgi:hypothetical protein
MMTLAKVEHILRAAGNATGHKAFVLIGSSAIFIWSQIVPEAMAMSREADLFANVPDADEADRIADELDAILGQASPFDDAYGYYCDGVGPETAILPTDWRGRAKLYASASTGGVSALVPEPHDLALSKLSAGREKDMDWLAAAIEASIVSVGGMRARLQMLPVERVLGGMAVLEQRLTILERHAPA